MEKKMKTRKDGLVLRTASREDIPRIAEFNETLHPDPGEPEIIGKMLHTWTMDLGNGKHPTTDAHHFTLVEDPANDNKLVSTMCVIPETWVYAGIPFKVGRIELVGTLPEYRRRGLIREQFNWHHRWCQENGYLVQTITGIPHYYRQFGYEMSLNLSGAIQGGETSLPLKHEGEEAFTFRSAEVEDIPFLMAVEEKAALRSVTSCFRSEQEWIYEIAERSKMSIYYRKIDIILDQETQPVGFLVYPNDLWGKDKTLNRFEVIAGVNWQTVTPTVLRHIWRAGQANAAKDDKLVCTGVRFSFGTSHPAYAIANHWLPIDSPPYSWYVRVGNLPEFIKIIAPILEKRLENSVLCDHSGELLINFYTDGLKIVFDNGKINLVEQWRPKNNFEKGHACLPGTTFYHLLFGHRDIDEIHHLYTDASVNKSMKALLMTLFPKQITEDIWALA